MEEEEKRERTDGQREVCCTAGGWATAMADWQRRGGERSANKGVSPWVETEGERAEKDREQ